MFLNNLEPKNLTDFVYMSFLLLSKEDKISLFPKIYSEMFRVQANANNFDDFVYADDKNLDNYVETITCPEDKTHDIVKNGKDRNGRQRFKCKNCNKTFFATQHTLSSNVNQDIAIWFRFISGMLKQESIESLAKACSISSSTAMNWQLRVFEAIRVLEEDVQLSGVVAADETFFDYSLKGNHAEDFIMPRRPRKRGNQNTIKNRNQNSICVLCAIDSENRAFSRIIGFGNSSSERIVKGFKNKLSDTVDVLVTDGAKAFGKSVKEYKIPRWERLISKKCGRKRVPDISGDLHIQKVNSYHSKLKRFMAKYKGVSSRRLPGYLLVFDFLQNHKGEDIECMCSKILSVMALPTEEISYDKLNAKYSVPVSNGGEKETWEIKVPKKEQKIYIDWYNRVPIAEITVKYKVNRRKIYTIKDKVTRLNLHDRIISPVPKAKPRKLKKLTDKTISIYMEYTLNDISQSDLARKYNMTRQGINYIIQLVKERPEAAHLPKRKSQHQKSATSKVDYIKRDKEIYAMFKFLNSEGVILQDIYLQISRQFSISRQQIQRILHKQRTADRFATFKYHWTNERKNLSKDDFDLFIKARNSQIYEEYLHSSDFGIKGKQTKLINDLANKYRISYSHCQLVIRNQRHFMQQEQNRVQELNDEELLLLH